MSSSKVVRQGIATIGGRLADLLPSITAEQQAQLDPKRITREARLDALLNAERKRAFDEGYAAGFSQGRLDGFDAMVAELEDQHRKEIESFMTELDGVGEEIRRAIERWFKQAEESLGRLAADLASRLIHAELQQSREATLEIVKDALDHVLHGTTVRIRVNPFDFALLEARKADLLAAATRLRSIEIVPDERIGAGCMIESDGGLIDARIEEMVAKLAQETIRLS
ncbi:MAG: hypothetical protein HONBIEJF_03011 [Fimbriimonadaceae bacterium]|nr:hypothetical protein [Fimbriimonadaceae bacterium]